MAVNNNRIYKVVETISKNPKASIGLKASDSENVKTEVMEFIKEIKKLLRKGYDPTTVSFIMSHDIDEEAMSKDEEGMIYSPGDVNRIIRDNYFPLKEGRENKKINIADIVGSYTQRDGSANILDTMKKYFKYGGESYSSRDNDYLNFESFEEAAKYLKNKPIDVSEFDNGNYVVADDGIHTYMILRALYLDECEKGNKKNRNNYMVPATVERIDLDMTYSQFMIRELFGVNSSITRTSENKFILDLEYGKDGRYCKEVNRKIIKNIIGDALDYYPGKKLEHIKNAYGDYDSFREYIDDNYPDYSDKIVKAGKGRGR